MADTFKITILEDGTIKTETDKVSMPNHANAEAFLREMGRLAGGSVERKRRVSSLQQSAEQHAHSHG
jgi:hypothetical protein